MLDPISAHLFKKTARLSPIVLVYHSAQPHNRNDKWSIELETFRKHMKLIRNYNLNTVTIDQLIKTPSLDSKTIAITFDDGYMDNFEAFKIIEEAGMRATWYIITDAIEKTSSVFDQHSSNKRMLDMTHLREMSKAGMEIGSHSCSHPRLTHCNPTELDNEIISSKNKLEDILSASVNSFAYPFGDYNDKVKAIVKNNGYASACTTKSGTGLIDNNPFLIRRISVFSNDSVSSLARKIAFADNDANWIKTTNYISKKILSRI